MIKLCRNHKKITQDMDVLSIIYDNSEEFPKESDSSVLKMIMTSDDRQEKMVTKIMKEVTNSYRFIEYYSERYNDLVEIYFNNCKKYEKIDSLTSRDHETISNYMKSWKVEQEQISKITEDHESALFHLNLKDFRVRALEMATSCYNKVKSILPRIF